VRQVHFAQPHASYNHIKTNRLSLSLFRHAAVSNSPRQMQGKAEHRFERSTFVSSSRFIVIENLSCQERKRNPPRLLRAQGAKDTGTSRFSLFHSLYLFFSYSFFPSPSLPFIRPPFPRSRSLSSHSLYSKVADVTVPVFAS